MRRTAVTGPGGRPGAPWAVLLILTLCAPSALEAQVVVGQVQSSTGQPLRGAFVQLEDTAGARVGGVLADSLGRFTLRAPAAGPYRVIAELIGYAGAASELLSLTRPRATQVTLEVPVEAVMLGGIRAQVAERCTPRPGSGPATARLWDEAQKALRVTEWTRGARALRFQAVEYLRTVDARTLEVLSHDQTSRSGFYAQSPYLSVPSERLEASGYVQRPGPGSMWSYYAPDATVLLSASFLDTHCFRVVRSRDEPGRVGLGFEPVPDRHLPDIVGTLWLDEATAELRRLDFTYTNLPFVHGRWPQVGGEVVFERLTPGMWIVRKWYVRMPRQAVRRGGDVILQTLLEQGAEIHRVIDADGTVLAEPES